MIRSLALLPLLPLLALGCVDDGDDGAGPGGTSDVPVGLAEDLTALASYPLTASGELGEARYHSVPADLEDAQADEEVHLAIWDLARPVFASHLDWMDLFVVFTDGADNTLAQVFTVNNDPTRWALAFDHEDALDTDGTVGGDAVVFTLVHEFAHVLSLNADQITFDPDLDSEDQDAVAAAAADCETHYLDEGCPLPDAYIQRFHETFWTDLADYEAEVDALDEDASEEVIAAKYAEEPERFVSEYAATNVAEDFAESFAYFVFEGPNGDLERDEKVRFFEQFPEVVQIRDDILGAGLSASGQGLTARGLTAGRRCR